ncbi:uncharacterized protein HD556DRAFT_1444087 [Suillus plorans]|uniref:Heterokaryon incompatibility domain-containing protein n=1 Tax=Suillus plorans TaxID=116603 RepID=A0A9P7DHK8_9AGAM|nr:uncharacterized protein HD556DRAFT_1444087 [Suillus plorans]KAG1792993.1 hypothetical protein HD556DRAFT_1444087 [Suillus plorans]
MLELSQIATPLREFKGHKECMMAAVAVLPDKRRMVTGSCDKTLRLWDLKTGVVLKNMEGHRSDVQVLTVSGDGQLIASGDLKGDVIIWHGETGNSLTEPIKAHSSWINSMDFSPDRTVLATGSCDGLTKLWNTKTWEQQGNPVKCGSDVKCVRYSPSGQLLAIATKDNIQIYNPGTRECVASFKAHNGSNMSLTWTPDGTRLVTGGSALDPTIRKWDTTTWEQVGDPWIGHSSQINAIAIHPAGILIASASDDNHVCLWRLSDGQNIATFKHSSTPLCVTFSVNGKHILSGGQDNMISEWAILAITTARVACIDGDLSTAEGLLTQDINTNVNNHASYAHRSFLMARQYNWDRALQDAIKSISIRPSLTGYISKGIALCGKDRIADGRAAFDVASMYTDQDPKILHFLLLIKAIALFNADQHDEANLLLKELAAGCPNADALPCDVVQAYLRLQLGIKVLDDARYEEAADHFTAVLNFSAFSSSSSIHAMYEDLVVLFGWDLESLWLTANQKRCNALVRADRLQDAVKSYQYMTDNIDETTKVSCVEWSNGKSSQECSAIFLTKGDTALAVNDFDSAIHLYSAAIDLTSPSDAVFANRSMAKLGKKLWEDALLDAQKVTELNPSSNVGYRLIRLALRGAQRYDEAIPFEIMLSKWDDSPEAQIRYMHQQYVCPSEAEDAIQKAVWMELEYAPLRLLNTSTGLLCDRAAQINAFKMSAEYKELLSCTTEHSGLQLDRIKEVVAIYFRCVMLSHRWEEKEALLHDIQDKDVRELKGVGGIAKVQSFCKVARDAGYLWAWMDTCCIDKKSNTEVQESINSMFVWYHHSALTIVYLCDVPSSSPPGALARSVWNKRGWTFQELLAPKVVIFYRKDWSLYLDDRSPNHKESPAIMKELEDATGIDARALMTFCPGMSGAREKLQWASKRVTTVQEDVAYSLFGIFGITLPVIYGEKKQNALGRLMQEIVARSGDIFVLDWIGEPSEFNSCLPAISPPTPPPPHAPFHPYLALKFYVELEQLRAPRFANCRLHLPCISYRVTEVRRMHSQTQEALIMYKIKADGLHDLLIITKETLVQFWWAKPIQQTFLLVRPWDRYLLGVPDFAEQLDFADDPKSIEDCTEPGSLMDHSDKLPGGLPVEEEPGSRALRLMVRLGQPFDAFLLAQQRVGEYKRIASDYNIIAQVKDIVSIDNMDIGTASGAIASLCVHSTLHGSFLSTMATSASLHDHVGLQNDKKKFWRYERFTANTSASTEDGIYLLDAGTTIGPIIDDECKFVHVSLPMTYLTSDFFWSS